MNVITIGSDMNPQNDDTTATETYPPETTCRICGSLHGAGITLMDIGVFDAYTGEPLDEVAIICSECVDIEDELGIWFHGILRYNIDGTLEISNDSILSQNFGSDNVGSLVATSGV